MDASASSGPETETSTVLARRRKLPRNVRRLAENLNSRTKPSALICETTPTPGPVVVTERQAPTQPRVRSRGAPIRRRGRWTSFMAVALLCVVAVFGLAHASGGVPMFATRAFTSVSSFASKRNADAAAASFAFSFGEKNPDLSSTASDTEKTTHSEELATRGSINREGHGSIPGGILVLPKTFVPDADGAYDLLVHFHGNTAVVKESVEVAKLNAAVAIVNLGIGSLPYEEFYAVPGTYEELLASVQRGLESRGVVNAHLRRVALSGWSAGYGSISTILQVRKKTEELDAVLILDGIHCGWENGALNARQMHPWVELAKRAANDELYFGITHSSIDPRAYASTTATASYLLDAVGATRESRDPVRDAPRYLELASMNGAIAKKLEKTMDPISEAHKGSFHVTGFTGETPEHHMEHLFQMGATLLPELVARWSR